MWKYGLLNKDFRYIKVKTGTQSKVLYETEATGIIRYPSQTTIL